MNVSQIEMLVQAEFADQISAVNQQLQNLRRGCDFISQ